MIPFVSVTLGRNVGTEPMPREEWRAFRLAARNNVQRNVTGWEWCEEHKGTGQWEGVPEQSAKITVFGGTPNLAEIQSAMIELCERYGQDAIAIASGTSFLAER